MNRYPYFPFYPNDFVSDDNVDSMSTLGLGAYIRLLCKAWHQEPVASLPNDQSRLAQWAKLDKEDWSKVGGEVLAAFTLGRDGRLHQKRMKVEYQKLREQSKAKSQAGLKGALTRWPNGSAIAKPKHSHSNATDPPLAKDGYTSSSSISSSKTPEGVGVSPSPKDDPKTVSDAMTFARNWISAECMAFIRSGPAAFERLIIRLGKDEAVRQVQEAMGKPDVGNPFTWLEGKLDKQSAAKAVKESAAPARLTKAWVSDV